MSSSLPFGAPLPTKTASNSLRVEQRLEAVDRRVVAHLDAHVDDVADLFVEDLFGQAERRDVDPHQAAGPRQLLEDRHVIAERHQIVGHRQRRRAGADERHLLAVLLPRRLRQPIADVVLVIRGDALQPADRHRLAVDARPPARRLAGPVARAARGCPGTHSSRRLTM